MKSIDFEVVVPLDRQEYDPDPDDWKGLGVAQDKVIKEKRRKLLETLDRVLKLYSRDDPDRSVEVKRMIADYEREKRDMAHHFDAIRSVSTLLLTSTR